MSSRFFETSKEIANDFLQNIVFIDDRAFPDVASKLQESDESLKRHEFDAKQITRVFANSRKVCAVYKPETLKDIENLALLAKKADVTVLDWQINIPEEATTENGEEDAEDDDPRGPHTRKIIREILSDSLTGKGSLKLILIYTGEIDLPGITDDIFNDLKVLSINGLTKGDCIVYTENIRILVLAKPSYDEEGEEPKFKHNPELKNKIVLYNELPDFVLTQFTKMTAGLLSNFVLRSLTIIRANTFRLVKLYKKELDPSFLSHRLLLPNPEDSKEQLVEILSHSIEALLNYNETGKVTSIRNIKQWIDSREFHHKIPIEKNKEILIDREFIKNWVNSSFIEACKKQWVLNGYSNTQNTPDSRFKKVEKDLFRKASELFNGKESEDIDSEFSILTHHKSNLKQPSQSPNLTLGVLIKQLPKRNKKKSKQEEKYFLCIQAKCDSVRINNTRKFMFLPLERVGDKAKFHFVIEDQSEFVRLIIKKETFELRTIKFQPDIKNQVISAKKYKENYYFKSIHGERFKWLADLKDAHAQREVNKFASNVSRVGLDESEWLRGWATYGK